METLGRNIKSIRRKWKFNQSDFGELMNVTGAQISQYEIGNNDPRIPFLIKLQDLTGVNCKRLYQEDINRDEIPTEPLENPLDFNNTIKDSTKYEMETKQLNELTELVKRMLARIEKLENDKDKEKTKNA